jgi:hypothetical protein
LPYDDLALFRKRFHNSHPTGLDGIFREIPALSKWFDCGATNKPQRLNTTYLEAFGDMTVPIEVTTHKHNVSSSVEAFHRKEAPLWLFLQALSSPLEDTSIYIAQCPISDLPPALRMDLPTPRYVLETGNGDIYGSSIWLGLAPTYTPLHRDPNPNLFIQLAGSKVIRMMEPKRGLKLYERIQAKSGKVMSAKMQGEDMMLGSAASEMKDTIWGTDSQERLEGRKELEDLELLREVKGLEFILNPGDGLFIPKGWWHSVRSIGKGIIGSVSLLQGWRA